MTGLGVLTRIANRHELFIALFAVVQTSPVSVAYQDLFEIFARALFSARAIRIHRVLRPTVRRAAIDGRRNPAFYEVSAAQ